MGLFDFVNHIGHKIFNTPEEASQAVTEHINNDNPGIKNVSVHVENGVANISGQANDAAALEKTILMTGNIEGISTVNADAVNITNNETLANDDEFYTIQKGDTLWKIAEKIYNDGSKYTAIAKANKEVIKDANKIFVGQKIRIPKSLA